MLQNVNQQIITRSFFANRRKPHPVGIHKNLQKRREISHKFILATTSLSTTSYSAPSIIRFLKCRLTKAAAIASKEPFVVAKSMTGWQLAQVIAK